MLQVRRSIREARCRLIYKARLNEPRPFLARDLARLSLERALQDHFKSGLHLRVLFRREGAVELFGFESEELFLQGMEQCIVLCPRGCVSSKSRSGSSARGNSDCALDGGYSGGPAQEERSGCRKQECKRAQDPPPVL